MAGISGVGGYSSYGMYGKIASGNRIQKASDDPAGQAIASKMETQRSTQNMQARNAAMQRDAINVADAGRSGMASYMQDINELSIQAMNGTMSDSDRQAIQNQINQYMGGIADTVRQTRYNESNVLGNGDTAIQDFGLEGYDVTGGTANTDSVSSAFNSVTSERASDGAVSNGLSASISNLASGSENTTASLSRITDQDIAEASTDLKKQQALDKYAVSMQKRQMEDQQSLMNRMFA
ncbi:MAG: hypothetical protein IJV04_01325 [Lachnospiraceae bacterium]|nr:hypothetical protein [Lachnospiraceae bacterium]